jgi:hypothetical protein
MKIFFTIIILLTSTSVYSIEKEPDKIENIKILNDSTEVKPENIRTVFISLLGFGFSDVWFYRLGYQINRKWSVALKASLFLDDGKSRSSIGSVGVGTRVTHYLDSNLLWIINNYSGEIVVGRASGMLEANVGYESVRNRLITFYYAVGINYLFDEGHYPYLSPSFKFGMNINF